ncbi:MAG: hypothetical protein II402_08640, partial [Bacteroidaceae bacterium]|nr:hypothetical protein [Bacteroidaceae bacterium]
DWSHKEGAVVWRIGIPANTSALVALPQGKQFVVNGAPLNQSPHHEHEGSIYYEFESGQYEIEIKE